ncbi:MAG: hypothetical protein ABI559_12355 [Chloroflexota bacterium]
MSNRGFLALIDLVRHIRAGPRALWIDKEENWLESFIKLGQQPISISGGPMEAASIYVVPRMLASTSRTVVTRFLSWDRAGDQTMSKRWPVTSPTVKIEYFRLPESDLPALDAAAAKLQKAYPTVPLDAPGLDLGARTEPTARPGYRGPANTDHWLVLSLSGNTVELNFTSSSPELDAAWLDLWAALKQERQNAIPASSVREIYSIDPETYARMLFEGD